LIDLDHWLSERYRISAPAEEQANNRPTKKAERDEKGGSD
jgi:endogenous inhibitor of DNA gyrase (YacG/DUF329 family)